MNEGAVTLDTGGGGKVYDMPNAADVAASDARQFSRNQAATMAPMAPMAASLGTGDVAAPPAAQPAIKSTFAVRGTGYGSKEDAQKAAEAYNAPDAVNKRIADAYRATGRPAEALQTEASAKQGKLTDIQLSQAQAAQAHDLAFREITEAFSRNGWSAVPKIYENYKDGKTAKVAEDGKGGAIVTTFDADGKQVGQRAFANEMDFITGAVAKVDPKLWVSMKLQDKKDAQAQSNADRTFGLAVNADSRGLDLADVRRTGPDWRGGKNVTAEDVKDAFGFRGVNLGEYVKADQKVAQVHLNHAFDALHDLADLMGVPPKAISLNGTLGLAIGAQGSGRALAHFVPGVNEINITKASGAGALAHEWGHALDHYFGVQMGDRVARSSTPFLTESIASTKDAGGVRPDLFAAFKALVEAMGQRPMTEDEAKKWIKDQRELTAKRLKRWFTEFKPKDQAAFDALAEKLLAGDIGPEVDGSPENLAKFVELTGAKTGNPALGNVWAGATRLAELRDEARFMNLHRPQVPTNYAKASSLMDAGKTDRYWSSNREMFARAFESFVMDSLKDRQRESLYLSGLSDGPMWQAWEELSKQPSPYPKAEERLALQQAAQTLVDTVQTRVGDDGNVAMFSRSPATQFAYESRIDALFAGEKASLIGVRVLDRSDVLDMLGMGDQPVLLAEGKVIAGMANHPRMTAEVWKKVPGWIENPAAVFDSDTVEGRLVFVAPEPVAGSPALLVVEPNTAGTGGVSVHLLLNAYDAQGGRTPFARWMREGKLRLVDTKKFPALLADTSGLQLPGTAFASKPGTRKILTEKHLAGYRRANAPAAFLGDTRAILGRQESNERLVATQMLVDGLMARWKRAPEVIVARNMQDPLVPQAVRDYDATLQSQGSSGEARGFIYRGKVYLLADELKGPKQIAEVLFHEVLGHFGLRGAFGDGLKPILAQLGALRRAQVIAKARSYGLVGEDIDVETASDRAVWGSMSERQRLSAAEEVLAEMAQTRPELGYVKRAIAIIRSWIRRNVPGMKNLRLTDEEIITSFILPARGFVTSERETAEQALARAMRVFRDGDEVPAYSRATATDPENPDIMFSRVEPAGVAARLGDTLKAVTVANIKQRADFKLTDWLGLGLQALGRRQLVDIYGDMLPLDEYNRLVTQMEADKNEGGAEADQLATRWGKLKDERQLAELMHDATLAQIDPDKPLQEGDSEQQHQALRDRFNALGDDAKQVYRDAREAYRGHHDKVRQAIKERIERSELKGERKAALLQQMDDEFFKAVKGVYFPLARFGQYVVVAKGADGKVESVGRAETKAEAEALRRSMLSAFPSSKGFQVGRVILSKEFIADRDSVGRGFMTELYEVLDKQDMDAAQRAELEDTLGQLYLSSLPDLSWAKHGIHRKGTPGFSQDARRAFAQNMFHGARYLAKLRYSDLMQDELAAMQKHVDAWRDVEDFDQNKAQRVVDEFNKRHESLMNPKSNPLSTALTSFGFIFHMGMSPASAMANLSGTALVAYPIMGARWGFGKAGAALLKASQQAAQGKNDIRGSLNDDERAAYDEAVRAGTIDVTMAHDLAGIAQGEDAGVMWRMRPVMKWASFLFHHAERFNRQVTFVAAYRLAREAGADHAGAFEQATKATYDGHFDYGSANRPRIMQGNVAKVLLLFKQYGQNMVYTMARQAYLATRGAKTEAEKKARAEARKALGGLLTSHALAAGVLGLPMVSTLLAAASMVGSDDDEPWDAEVALRNLMADAIGQKQAEVLMRGLSRLTPWDISGRVGLDKLIFPDIQEGLEGQRLAESAMAAALGPVAGIGVNVLRGLQDMSEGHYVRGLEAMLPAALRGPMKSIRYANEGANAKNGEPILDEVSPAAVIGQALGFSPSEVRNAAEGKGAVMAMDRALAERRSHLVSQFAMAVMAKDEEGKQEARQAIARFNEKNPGRRILPRHLMASVKVRQKRINEARDGVYLPKGREDAREAGRFATAE